MPALPSSLASNSTSTATCSINIPQKPFSERGKNPRPNGWQNVTSDCISIGEKECSSLEIGLVLLFLGIPRSSDVRRISFSVPEKSPIVHPPNTRPSLDLAADQKLALVARLF